MTDKHANIETPYTAVYLIFKKANKIAFLLRSNTGWMNGFYGLPAGRVERGESFIKAAIREALEEVGATISSEYLKPIMFSHRNDPDSVWVDVFFEVQQWQGDLRNAEPDIHGELVWFDPQNLPENIIPSVRFYIEQYLAGKNYCEFGWEI